MRMRIQKERGKYWKFWYFLSGHYVPQLAQLIVQSNAKINLKGIAVSNKTIIFIDFLKLQWKNLLIWTVNFSAFAPAFSNNFLSLCVLSAWIFGNWNGHLLIKILSIQPHHSILPCKLVMLIIALLCLLIQFPLLSANLKCQLLTFWFNFNGCR